MSSPAHCLDGVQDDAGQLRPDPEKRIVHGIYPAIATHDEYLVCRAIGLIAEHGLTRDRYG